MPRYLTAALYKFVTLPDCAALREPIQAVCDANGVKGTVLLALEGINGTISGLPEGVGKVLAHLRADPRLATLVHKESWADNLPFLRMKVRLKKEIVTLGVPGVSPTLMAGQYVKPQDWNALINNPDVVLIDTRNDYEVDIGTFKGAVDPRLKTFADLPEWVAAQEQGGGVLHAGADAGVSVAADAVAARPDAPIRKKPKVAMFCTGGIRCEKSTAYLRQKGYDEVYHLEGGILKYLEQVPPENSLWQGECFVFDERVSVGHGLTPGPYELCRSCRHPVGDVERASPKYEKGVSCPHCFDLKTPVQKQGFAERQRQVELAVLRGKAHVGAKMPHKPKRLDDPVAHLIDLLNRLPASPDRPGGHRILIALAGGPGSGKSSLSNHLAQQVNVKIGAQVVAVLGMDGFHLSRAQLAAFPDPAAALLRRGAPWTFDARALAERLVLLRGTLNDPTAPTPTANPAAATFNPSKTAPITWPGFEHGMGDPVPDAVTVGGNIQLVIVEGLYLLHQGDGWDLSHLFDERWYLDTPLGVAMERLVQRHISANGNTREQAERRLALNDRLNAGIVQKSRVRADWLLL